ncbi:MAG TPA: DUF5752 family protein [Candidatus Binatia bacterium]|nr:DUF5752 family protein [Candidatus Solibacter sp.]HUK52690.1 DUF5752 family protein [Candidatus Binatia bacterium]
MKSGREPFRFVTASYLIRICGHRAVNLREFAAALRVCPDASIFHHTFQSLERHHYASFSNDFAQWVLASCNEPALAERLAAIDIRDCTSIAVLRNSLEGAVQAYLERHPVSPDHAVSQPFYFCESLEFTEQRNEEARTLAELAEGIGRISLQTLHHHFINSRLRLHLETNDFSHWIRNSLEQPELAGKLDRIDIYMNTLDGLRQEILRTLESWVRR